MPPRFRTDVNLHITNNRSNCRFLRFSFNNHTFYRQLNYERRSANVALLGYDGVLDQHVTKLKELRVPYSWESHLVSTSKLTPLLKRPKCFPVSLQSCIFASSISLMPVQFKLWAHIIPS